MNQLKYHMRKNIKKRGNKPAHTPVRSEAIFANQGIVSDNGQTVGNEQDAVARRSSGQPSLFNFVTAHVAHRSDDQWASDEEEKSVEERKP